MKRYLSALLSLLFIFSAVACSDKRESSQVSETTTETAVDPTSTGSETSATTIVSETSATTATTVPATPEVTGLYMMEGTSEEHASYMELARKDDRLGVLFRNVDYDSEYIFCYFIAEPEDGAGIVTAVYDEGTFHFELSTDGKTADVIYRGDEENASLSGHYERKILEDVYLEDAFPEAVNDPATPNGAVDAALAKTVRERLGLPEDAVLTEEDLVKIEELDVSDEKPVTLNGIEYFTGLKRLSISKSYIKDISPLAKISTLEDVDIGWSFVDTIPDLSNCEKLTRLSLPCCLIRDISPVTKIRALSFLDLSSNRITSIAPIKDNETLTELNLLGNPITDWDVIKDNQTLIKTLTLDYDTTLLVLDKAREFLKDTINDDMSELEKEFAICMKLHEKAHSECFQRPMRPDGYYILMEGRGVCVDWAKTVALLMNLAGLECFEIQSDTHMWNIIRIDGEYYELDCYWDDEVEPLNWNYFNISRARMDAAPDHKVRNSFYERTYFPVAIHSMMKTEFLMCIDQTDSD